jgi:hypothetical protein
MNYLAPPTARGLVKFCHPWAVCQSLVNLVVYHTVDPILQPSV